MNRDCAHDWKRIPAVVVTVLDPPEWTNRECFNAKCSKCGMRAWLHWPSGSLAAEKVQRR